jgi:hypothetical protein
VRLMYLLPTKRHTGGGKKVIFQFADDCRRRKIGDVRCGAELAARTALALGCRVGGKSGSVRICHSLG